MSADASERITVSERIIVSNRMVASTRLDVSEEVNDSIIYIASDDFLQSAPERPSGVLWPSNELIESENFVVPNKSEDSGLSGAAVAGIVIGALVIIVCLILIIVFAMRSKDRSSSSSAESSSSLELEDNRSVEDPRSGAPKPPAVPAARPSAPSTAAAGDAEASAGRSVTHSDSEESASDSSAAGDADAPPRLPPPESAGGFALAIDEAVGRAAFKEIASGSEGIQTESSSSVGEVEPNGDRPKSASDSGDGEGPGSRARDSVPPPALPPPASQRPPPSQAPEAVPSGSDYEYTSGSSSGDS
jgi:hypothetical protein